MYALTSNNVQVTEWVDKLTWHRRDSVKDFGTQSDKVRPSGITYLQQPILLARISTNISA